MTDEGWATFWLIVAVACMVALWVFLASVKLLPSYSVT